MNSVKEIDIENCTYYFLDDMINVKNTDPSRIKIDENSYKNILIYYTGYGTKNNVKPLYLIINKTNGNIEKSNRDKSLTLVPNDEGKETLEMYEKLWEKIKDPIISITNRSGSYDEKYMKIKFNSDVHLPLIQTLELHNIIKIARSVFFMWVTHTIQAFS